MNNKELTTIRLDGILGKKFGRVWKLAVSSPVEALRLIDVNRPGILAWIRNNLEKYDSYRITCEFEGREPETLCADDLSMKMQAKTIRFTPIVQGAGRTGQIIAGAVLIIAAIVTYQYYAVGLGTALMIGAAGASIMMSGIIGATTSMPKNEVEQRKDQANKYFDGPVNTTMQGVPVPLIYGKDILVGSHTIYAGVTVRE